MVLGWIVASHGVFFGRGEVKGWGVVLLLNGVDWVVEWAVRVLEWALDFEGGLGLLGNINFKGPFGRVDKHKDQF